MASADPYRNATTLGARIINALVSVYTAKGDLAIGSGPTAAARLAVGTDGQVLLADSTAANGVAWGAPATGAGFVASDPLYNAKGDLPVGTANDTAARLAVGTNGQVLSADSSAATGLKWVAAAAGAGDLLSTNNLSDLADEPTARANLGLGALSIVTPGTGVAAALAINVGSAGAPVLFNGALGTPTSGVGTALTALNASNLSTGTVATARLGSGSASSSTYLRGDGTWATIAAGGDMLSTNNLSELTNAGTARTNLGLGALSTVTPGTGVATALAVNTGTAGAFVVLNGALGTPTSGVGTALTALNASNLGSGTVPTARMGSGSASSATFLRGDNTWATVAGSGDMLAANNLSDLANAGTARTNLGVAIGSNVQAYAANLTTFAGITPGTGIGAALAVNIGSAGAPVLFNGALGTPSSGVGTALTSLNASNLSTGTVATSRLGSGTANSTTYLRGDNTWQTISGSFTTGTITGQTEDTTPDAVADYLISYDASANALKKVLMSNMAAQLAVDYVFDSSTGFKGLFDTSALTIDRTITTPNANCTFVVPSSAALGQCATAISSSGVVTYSKPGRAVTAKTGNYTVTTGDTATVFTNTGAGAAITLTLPAAVVGNTYTFSVETAQTLNTTANGTDTLRLGASVSAAGGKISSAVIGTNWTVVCTQTGKWVVIASVGTPTVT